ncbi:MAG TPA: hypothetical protein VFQ35_17570 [Polyangiaceae bacterium]|nr:hypothetical protein [Polyangiaceae bacterium]
MRWLLSSSVFAFSVFSSTLGCAERHASVERPPSESSVLPAAPASATSAVATPSASTAPSAQPLPAKEASAAEVPAPKAPAEAEAEAEPPLTGPDGKTLPQTEERPSIESPAFKRRIERLAQCILRDDPSICSSSFFPLLAYREVKAVEKPERDYQYRLVRHFERDIHEYHKALGDNAKFEGIDVPEASARWMKPGSEGNKLGYYRVLRSRLRFTKSNGKAQNFELTSMISWRGEWYVVHLHGFE